MTKIACLGAEILLSMYLTLSTQPAFADLIAKPLAQAGNAQVGKYFGRREYFVQADAMRIAGLN
jgi:hypothetical protein